MTSGHRRRRVVPRRCTAFNKPQREQSEQRTAFNKPQRAQSAQRKGHTALALAPGRLPSTPKPFFFVVVGLLPLCVLCVLWLVQAVLCLLGVLCGFFSPSDDLDE
jgi:hypothetical protein